MPDIQLSEAFLIDVIYMEVFLLLFAVDHVLIVFMLLIIATDAYSFDQHYSRCPTVLGTIFCTKSIDINSVFRISKICEIIFETNHISVSMVQGQIKNIEVYNCTNILGPFFPTWINLNLSMDK